MAKTVKEKILNYILKSDDAALLTSEFLRFGSESQVSRALKQLISQDLLIKAGYGVYVKAKMFKIPSTGEVKVIAAYSIEEIGYSSMNKLGVKVSLTKAQRDYSTGASSQIPLSVINTNDKRITRKIAVGKAKVKYENNYRSRKRSNSSLSAD